MALAVPYTITTTVTTAASQLLWTVPSSGNFGTYARDIVITNGGPSTVYLAMGAGTTGGATVTSFAVPTGGSVLLTNCQVPAGSIIGAISAGTSSTSIGFGSVVSVI